jgi:hypothetical protein
MSENRNFTLRVSDSWIRTLDTLTGKFKPKKRSQVLRELVAREERFWELAPYTADETRILVLVPSTGNKLYWLRQQLRIHAECTDLPFLIGIKVSWKKHFEDEDNIDPQAVRDKWLINYFSAWSGTRVGEELIAQDSDRLGTVFKYTEIPVNQQPESALTKEIIASFDEYVAKYEPDVYTHDRSDVAIDIPTLNFEIQVIVDLDLYNDEKQRRFAGLACELRNRDSFKISTGPTSLGIEWDKGRYPLEESAAPHTIDVLERVKKSIEDLRGRLERLTSDDAHALDGQPIVQKSEHRQALRSLALPDQFLFGRVRWEHPLPSMVVSVTWNRPR